MGSDKPHLALGPDGSVYVAWEEGHEFITGKGEPSSSMIIASPDGGLTWEEPTTFIFPGDTPQSIAVGVDGNNRVVVVWQQVVGNGVFYQTSADHGQSWSAPRQIPNILTRSLYNDLDDYDIAADAAGHLHLVLVGQNPQAVVAKIDQNSVYHLEWDGATWSEPTPIFTTIGDVPEWPRIAVGQGNQLNVVWFIRDKANVWSSDTGKYEIWYTRGSSSAPAVAPISWPTPTPTPTSVAAATPTLTPVPTAIPTQIPTLDPSLTQISAPADVTTSIYSDNDEVLLLAKSLLPAALIIVVVVVTVRFWRR
jgi:hypothetical protein